MECLILAAKTELRQKLESPAMYEKANLTGEMLQVSPRNRPGKTGMSSFLIDIPSGIVVSTATAIWNWRQIVAFASRQQFPFLVPGEDFQTLSESFVSKKKSLACQTRKADERGSDTHRAHVGIYFVLGPSIDAYFSTNGLSSKRTTNGSQ